jgi:cytoskeleton protein RodZ
MAFRGERGEMTLVELGQEIRTRREEAGLSLDDVAMHIKVSPRILQAIEAGAMESLPHAVYAKGFTRSFALVVGFSPEDIAARLEEIFPLASFLEDNANAETIARLHTPPPSRVKKKIFVVLFLLCCLAGIGGGVYYVVVHHGTTIWDFIRQPFSAITTPDVRDASPEETASTTDYGSASVALASLLPAAAQSFSAGAENVESAVPAPEEAAPPVASPETSQATNGTTRIPVVLSADALQSVEIQATQECWISFRADKARTRDHFTLLPGQSRSFSFKDFLEVHLGNAGGVRIFYNTTDLGELGRPGEVKLVRFPEDAAAHHDTP